MKQRRVNTYDMVKSECNQKKREHYNVRTKKNKMAQWKIQCSH